MLRNRVRMLILVAGVASLSLTGGCAQVQAVADSLSGQGTLSPAASLFPAMTVPVLAATGNEKAATVAGFVTVMINLAAIQAEKAREDERREGERVKDDVLREAKRSHPGLDESETLVAYPVGGEDGQGRKRFVLIDPVTKEVKDEVIVVPEKEREAIGSNGAIDVQREETIPVIGGKKVVFVEQRV